jgi:predicted ATPase
VILKKLQVSNFKSFRNLEVDFDRFNVLIGANASGKSNLLQVFRFLRDIQAFGLENAISLQGGVEYLRNLNIGAEENLSISVVVEPDSDMLFPVGPFIQTTQKGGTVSTKLCEFVYQFSLRFHKRGLRFRVVKDRIVQKYEFIRLTPQQNGVREKEELGKGDFVFSQVNGKVKFEPKLPDNISVNEQYMSALVFLGHLPSNTLLLEHLFSFFRLAGAVDFNEISFYDFEPKLPKQATPITGKADLEEDGSNLAIVLRNILADKEQKRKLANLMKALLPFVRQVDVEKFADKSLLFKLQEVYTEKAYLPASLASDGTISMIALIIALFFEKEPITIIEEPERNIHPHLISRVVDLMKDAAQYGHKQVIASTHNPEMVKYAGLDDILLVSRDKSGDSQIYKPAEHKMVKLFLENEMGMDELYVSNLLEGCYGL